MLQKVADEGYVIGALGAGRGTQRAALDEFLTGSGEIAQTEGPDHPTRCVFRAGETEPENALTAADSSSPALRYRGDRLRQTPPAECMAHAGHELGTHQDGAHQFPHGAFHIGPDVALKKITQIHNRPSSDSAETIPTLGACPSQTRHAVAQHDHEDDSLHDFTFFLRGILLIAVPSSSQYSTLPPLGPPQTNLAILPLFHPMAKMRTVPTAVGECSHFSTRDSRV